MKSLFRFWPWLGLAAMLTAGAVYFAQAAEKQKATGDATRPKDLTHMTDAELRKTLTPEQYNVCRQNGT